MIKISDAAIIDDAKRYQTRMEWKNRSSSLYGLVHRNRRHLLPDCTSHMHPPGGPKFGYQLYVYEFKDNSIYVGITSVPHRRHYNHRRTGPVFEQIQKVGFFNFTIVATGLDSKSARERESAMIEAFSTDGYRLLNRTTGGELGGIGVAMYSYEEMLFEAKKFASLSEFAAHSRRHVQWLYAKKLMPKIKEAMGWKNFPSRYEKEKCFAEARKWGTIYLWRKNSKPTYVKCVRYGWIDEIKSVLPSGTPKKWSLSKERDGARKLTFRGESRTIAGWAKIVGIHKNTINQRIAYGWSTEKAITTPVLQRDNNALSKF